MTQRKVSAEVVINRPIADVFSFIKDMNNHANWQTGVLESKIVFPHSAPKRSKLELSGPRPVRMRLVGSSGGTMLGCDGNWPSGSWNVGEER